jgi:hypothetical protein
LITTSDGVGWTSYYLDGSALGLCDTNIAANLGAQEVVRKDVSRIFENGYWRDEIGSGAHGPGDFATIAAQFFTSLPPTNEKWGANPKGVTDILNTFMYGYAAWANATTNIGGTVTPWCFIYATASPSSDKATAEYQLMNAVIQCFVGPITGPNSCGLLVPP